MLALSWPCLFHQMIRNAIAESSEFFLLVDPSQYTKCCQMNRSFWIVAHEIITCDFLSFDV